MRFLVQGSRVNACQYNVVLTISSFRLKQTVHYTRSNPGVATMVMPIEPTGLNVGMVVYHSSASKYTHHCVTFTCAFEFTNLLKLDVPHTVPSAIFDSQNERLLAREVVRQEPQDGFRSVGFSYLMIIGSIKLDI
jgi:hypothetical protein